MSHKRSEKVIVLDDHRPLAHWLAVCTACGRDWVAIVFEDMRAGLLECPECGKMKGIRTAPVVPQSDG